MISAPVHAPATGEVVSVGPALTPAGTRAVCVTIATDPDQDRDAFVAIRPTGTGAAAAARAAGLVGLGGAAFPAAVKLAPSKATPIDTVILNGCECEPYLTCDHRVMLERPERVVAGARLIAEAVGATRVVIAVEDNKPDAVEALRAVAGDVEVMSVTTRYPQGAEKQLIFSVTGRVVPGGKLPAVTGCLVHNVQTAAALADAVEFGTPLMERVVTVSGAVERPGNFLVAIGTPVSYLIEMAGGLKDDAARVIAGGPMTAQPLGDLEVPVVKGTSGIVALTAAEAAPIVDADQPCIRCGRCVEACPMTLHPYAIANYADRRNWDGCERFFALDCIECGCCSYV
jgi:electron transport complex protein RnfC